MKINYFFIPLLVAFVAWGGNIFTNNGMDWYKTLNLPDLAPDGSVIGAVWTLIFLLFTISVLSFWNSKPKNDNFNLIAFLFLANAVLNTFWSYLFFTLQQIDWSLIEMTILNLTNLLLILFLWKKNLLSAVLLIPYFLWVTFATYLSCLILAIN